MSDVAIRVENLSKLYRIGQFVGYKTLRESLANVASAPIRRFRSAVVKPRFKSRNPGAEYIWALKDISFEVKQGEVVGIIGRNGAGKTTLLKVLSRITEPTEGYAEIHGRVGSLLEVGTGFHPELTGRENIYLNGAVLGMKKKEIDRKFDEIVQFAGVEKFIDTPLKRYSTGMQVRLAFAVAAHLEPEVLLIDEVLAVGDIEFQKKSLGRMKDVATAGRTVLFVSHQMNQIRRLCERCIWLDAGRIQMYDTVQKVVSAYEAAMVSSYLPRTRSARETTRIPAQFVSWEIVEPKGEEPNLLTTLGPVTFKIIVQANKPIKNGRHGIALWNSDNQLMWAWEAGNLRMEAKVYEFVYTIPHLPLKPGIYYWHVSLHDSSKLLDEWFCLPEMIIGTKPLTHGHDKWQGILNLPCDFHIVERRG